MELRTLRYFLTVAREEGINRAAQVLHITQPTLSRQMAQLEEEMGVKLFLRGTKKITLTDEGMLLRRRAEEILDMVDRTERELTQQDEVVEGRIVIGGGELAAMQVLPQIIQSFQKKYPLVTYDLFTGNADLVKERMERGLIDIGVLLEPVDVEKFDFIRLASKERWVALLPPHDPLLEKPSVTPQDLAGKPLILPSRSNVQNEVVNWFGNCFREENVRFTSNFGTNGALMVRQGLACSLVVEGAIPFWDREELDYRPLSPALTASSVFAWKKHQPFSLATAKFLEHMRCFLRIPKP